MSYNLESIHPIFEKTDNEKNDGKENSNYKRTSQQREF